MPTIILSINEFNVGDEVYNPEISQDYFVIIDVDKSRNIITGMGTKGQTFMDRMPTKWNRTGLRYPEVVELLNKLEHHEIVE